MARERYKSLDEFRNSLKEIGLKALDHIYLDYRGEFLNFSRKYNLSEEDVNDIYQDTIIAFYENIINGKLTSLTSSIKTYLFSIGKYSIFNRLKKSNRIVSLEREHLENLNLEAIELDFQLTEKSTLVKIAMEKLGDRCRNILILFYYHSYTIEALMHELSYKNENVVRSHKSRCLRNLKDLIKGL